MERAIKVARINENLDNERLNELPDELILKIFSFLPMFKETVATELISRQWSEKDPWKLVSDVTLDDDDQTLVTFMSFVYGSLLSNDAQILERLHLKLITRKFSVYSDSDIDFVVRIAVNQALRKLRIYLFGKTLNFPSCLSNCTTLKSLILSDLKIEVFPAGFCLPSLKSLHLFSVKLLGNESVASLLQICPDLEYLVINETRYYDDDNVDFCLSSLKSLHLSSDTFLKFGHESDRYVSRLLQRCPVLECLVVNRANRDNVMLFHIDVPTLRSLSINESRSSRDYGYEGFVINAPALEELNFKVTCSNFVMFEYMPEVTKANIEVKYCDQSEKFIGSLTSIHSLSLCSKTSKTPYPRGNFFFFLEHLELCTCSKGWTNLLACLLNGAPRLQSLKLESKHGVDYNDPIKNHWIEPKVVPECLSKHLEILEWRQYEGTEQDREVAAYILANATCLKMGTFSISSKCKNKKAELKKMSRVSETCQLVFE
ncbi:putative FBD-associated F-box protein At5g56560 [Eutrema salsugineum]|uniref:putative FBD-associated F-box protein At5g56560 n=1 Tax=Eutrema salsugineum TaxID=72664 RepID=UPI000CED1E90|nr:putative FBD-associated F-box protein At5g56560 [Eutrema salsugineum]